MNLNSITDEGIKDTPSNQQIVKAGSIASREAYHIKNTTNNLLNKIDSFNKVLSVVGNIDDFINREIDSVCSSTKRIQYGYFDFFTSCLKPKIPHNDLLENFKNEYKFITRKVSKSIKNYITQEIRKSKSKNHIETAKTTLKLLYLIQKHPQGLKAKVHIRKFGEKNEQLINILNSMLDIIKIDIHSSVERTFKDFNEFDKFKHLFKNYIKIIKESCILVNGRNLSNDNRFVEKNFLVEGFDIFEYDTLSKKILQTHSSVKDDLIKLARNFYNFEKNPLSEIKEVHNSIIGAENRIKLLSDEMSKTYERLEEMKKSRDEINSKNTGVQRKEGGIKKIIKNGTMKKVKCKKMVNKILNKSQLFNKKERKHVLAIKELEEKITRLEEEIIQNEEIIHSATIPKGEAENLIPPTEVVKQYVKKIKQLEKSLINTIKPKLIEGEKYE